MILKAIRRTVLLLIYVYVSCSLLLFHGPFTALRGYVIDIFTTSMHGYLLRPLSMYTLSQAEINKHLPQLMNTGGLTNAQITQQNFNNINSSSIKIVNYKTSTFSAQVMMIRDPQRLQVAVTKYAGNVGQTVSQLVSEYHGVAGVNGGAFKDTKNWRGTGGIPLGITISNGKVIQADPAQQPVIALTKKGALIAGSYTLTQLKSLGVQEALSFGPVLVQNGRDMIQGTGGWGYAPRTAIGQTANGTILLVVTDGRFIHGPNNLGASLQDMAQLMLHYGAQVAANLDGGSSTTMVYNGKLVNEPSDVLGEREVATALVVMP
ncbi:phosphodiester glycosidase family protein [Alicyclobacillus tolerans]|uniref:phosphodiester glycosidase family protein n=1 Tax=Alicyclobacillus tolerans TaxID=90970 RepID=UPI001F47C997|nr:phosphodiester glycosidase family protein [Alicyclobacillus tolerans]MCF8567205.1 phosphodiester glycosidase family protein [Alicyclobacillus tolerans]